MPGKMLPNAQTALIAASTALKTATAAKPAGSGYGAAIAAASAAMGTISTQVNINQALLPPTALTTPPNNISISSCQSCLVTVASIIANIASTTAQSVAVSGAPSPSYAGNAIVVEQLCSALETQIDKLLVTPQLA